ncbi:HD domain-containing protein 2 isoform X1 [Cajanus cajan]|uniref:HD domain-containing protein 2 isoform X1 n=1 Tax=Cajanus cajan TaxID=3821 RepID=UPI00098D7DF4|nr:HD domain-containing protein 2 isoform X1 [Cajanus cajan]
MAISYSPVRCRVPSPHRTFASASILAPTVFFRDAAPSLRLVSVRSQAPGSDGVAQPKKHARASVGFSASSSSVIDFLTLCHRLKTTKRKGWVNHGIKGAESIADHMYRMALMALIAGDVPGLNRERCIKIALVHDIAEAIVGDITPSDGVPKAEKSRREQEALNKMCELLGGGMRAEEIKELWAEYENNCSLEANLVKDFDKVEMILQALEYEIEHGKVLDEFFLSTAGKFQTEIGKSWAAEIISRRKSLSAKRLS